MSSHLSASLIRLKLLDCLRAGDIKKVESLIEDLQSVQSTIETTELIRLRETVLHYAVQVAPLATIQALVESKKFSLDVNSQDMDGNTPLHLAVAAGRLNVVKYLLSLPNINDTVLNADRKQPVELSKDTDIAQLMQYERAKFVERAATDLRRMFSNRDFAGLENILVNNPRAAELLDINGADPETGNTVLHEFIRKEDFEMCDWILKHGGDPFKRDKRGKLPIDLVSSKADPIRRLLKVASRDQNMMDPVASTNNAIKAGNAPTYKGYLRKWTNIASGYKLRYFVLDSSGIVSYYTNQGDTINACRGSLNLGFATLHLDSSEKLKFEIIGKNGIKWHLKANHPVETNRWVWTLQNAITLAKDNMKRKQNASRRSVAEDAPKALEDTEDERRRSSLLHVPGRRKHKKSPSQVSLSSFTPSDAEDSASITSEPRSTSAKSNTHGSLSQINERKAVQNDRSSMEGLHYGSEDFDYDLEDSGSDYDGDSSADEPADQLAKYSMDQIQSTKRAIKVELASLISLFKDLGANATSDGNDETFNVGMKTLSNVQDLIDQLDTYNSIRDQKLLKKIDRQQEVNKLWESSIRQLENEIQKREEALALYDGKKYKLKKLLESKGMSPAHVSNEQATGLMNSQSITNEESLAKTETKTDQSQLFKEIFNDSEDEFFDADDFDEDVEESASAKAGETTVEENPTTETTVDKSTDKSESQNTLTNPDETKKIEPVATEDEAASGKTATKGTESISEGGQKAVTDSQMKSLAKLKEEGSFLGYEKPPRKKLAMDEDDRPKIGLWGILKSMIGKDMTHMSLPVSFNECTSLLQRLAEDIEYNDLLNKAASIPDSTLRIVYVATFAASEYASTIDRIAKPFNPLLGETFEYSRPDQSFRLLTEQVSHHPPISACHAESVKWDYYGENAVDTQFRGRSFDVKHLGKMFCKIRPDNGVVDKEGHKVQEELYSWKKVNTSVVGIIVGNPTVDNFGQMEVRNHTTGDVLIVDMKQRGWKASSAYQLSGIASDAHGKERWAIGGRWNSKIYAKKITGLSEKKRRNSLIDAEGEHQTSDPYSGRKFLVWQAAPRPKIPFNLTSFAVTLNEINDNIKPWLAPTDTRLRPDQRAMEDGRYDEASREKHRVEEKQRAARKRREQKREIYKPNWFVRSNHPVTGDQYWHYNDKYWPKRKNKELAGVADIF
ncbi:hypothetical protein CLUG_00817 [Clavispora lusitaniae ATCC 42720]|uniref:PH domain-containing protein n=1 Tax=Clavispora lusitaniae (strain ATCC 42720) TaxID=306902 RepID=C4XXZ4_CLAL4|nr:uncharacterized protein CLUG_00817 [Clavispora lusitaniae ATCC 42720]EEQ36694.1 hypothetical protein CLUG_00817 [Clavispora lusitaniae ATCC 42720]